MPLALFFKQSWALNLWFFLFVCVESASEDCPQILVSAGMILTKNFEGGGDKRMGESPRQFVNGDIVDQYRCEVVYNCTGVPVRDPAPTVDNTPLLYLLRVESCWAVNNPCRQAVSRHRVKKSVSFALSTGSRLWQLPLPPTQHHGNELRT